MQRRTHKAVAAAAVVFLVVNAFLSSWPEDTSYEYDASQHSRRLDGSLRAITPRERVLNELFKMGIRPGDPDHRRLLKARLARLEKRNEQALAHREMIRKLRNTKNIWFRRDAAQQAELEQKHAQLRELNLNNHAQKRELNVNNSESDLENVGTVSICGRPTMMGTASDLALLQNFEEAETCPGANSNKLLLLQGQDQRLFGRTGNNLIEFLHALQYARDHDVQLGIVSNSWAFEMLLKMWMSVKDDDWEVQFEEAFCVKIFNSQDETETQGYDLLFPELTVTEDFTKQLFLYQSERSLVEYIGHQAQYLQTLFKNYNTGVGTTESGEPVRDMCSGFKALFGDNKNAIYSVIHSRSLEEAGKTLLGKVAKNSGCDPEAALHMTPDYVKSILEPLGLLDYPIVLITDGQDFAVVQRLLNDPEIAPKLRLVSEEATWIGGDFTVAVMANAFIGNPASSFSGFIAKSRLALGFGQSYLFRAKNENGEWVNTCGDTCIYDKRIMGPMS